MHDVVTTPSAPHSTLLYVRQSTNAESRRQVQGVYKMFRINVLFDNT